MAADCQIDEVEPVHSHISLRITAEAAPEASRVKCDYAANACSNFNSDPSCVGGCPRGMITSMPRTSEEVIWSPRAWREEHGDEKTPDISAIIQEVIDVSIQDPACSFWVFSDRDHLRMVADGRLVRWQLRQPDH